MHAIPYGVTIPIRSFRRGMERLAPVLTPEARARLARRLADTVVTAAGDAPVVIVSDDDDVRRWAAERGLTVIGDPGTLDAAAAAGRAALAARGCVRAVIAHGDLPRARTFTVVARDAGRPVAVIVPCHRDDGTPVVSIPAAVPFAFSYGPGSFRRHVAAAQATGLAARVVRDPELAFDVDTPDDLAHPSIDTTHDDATFLRSAR